jgi:carbonic anhydrase/acetyltransferase-like protein (isoleucine patch superfamily)
MPFTGPDVILDNPTFIHESALLYGKITIGPESTVWPYVVMRAEILEIRIGRRTNIQDFVMIHIGNNSPTIIGDNCSITHHCTIHGASIGDNCLIGINATIMDGVKIGKNCIIAGHTIIKEDTVIPDNSIVAGSPGKVIRTMDNSDANKMNADFYYQNGINYSQQIYRM